MSRQWDKRYRCFKHCFFSLFVLKLVICRKNAVWSGVPAPAREVPGPWHFVEKVMTEICFAEGQVGVNIFLQFWYTVLSWIFPHVVTALFPLSWHLKTLARVWTWTTECFKSGCRHNLWIEIVVLQHFLTQENEQKKSKYRCKSLEMTQWMCFKIIANYVF